MRRLPVLIFAAGMAIWGLASIPDGSGANGASAAYRRSELARTPDPVLMTPVAKGAISALRAAPPESCSAVAAGRERVRVSLDGRL
jgi:hypothetical protein